MTSATLEFRSISFNLDLPLGFSCSSFHSSARSCCFYSADLDTRAAVRAVVDSSVGTDPRSARASRRGPPLFRDSRRHASREHRIDDLPAVGSERPKFEPRRDVRAIETFPNLISSHEKTVNANRAVEETGGKAIDLANPSRILIESLFRTYTVKLHIGAARSAQ